MKKFLMGTSALVGVTMLAGQAIAADKPTVSVGGYIDINVGAGSNNSTDGLQGVTTDAEVHVKASGKADNGLSYGAKIELEGSGGTSADEAMMWVSGSWGKIELGMEDGAGGRMMGNATPGIGTGGYSDGDWDSFMNLGGSIDAPGRSAAINSTNDDVKVQYYNSFGAVNVGASYMADTRADDNGLGDDSSTVNGLTNVIELGANWSGEVGNGMKARVGAAYATGDAAGEQDGALEDTNIWGINGRLASGGWAVEASYTDRGAAGESEGSTADETSWHLSAEYKTGPWTVGVEYLDRDNGESGSTLSEEQGMAIGFTYSVAPGLYVGGEIVDVERTNGTTSYDGQAVILTTGVSF